MLTKSWSPDASRDDSVLFVERANELVLCGLYKELCSGYTVKASVNSANISYGLDPKPGELHMGRVNPR